MKAFVSGLAVFAGLFCLIQPAIGKSTSVAWGTPTTISSDNDVSTSGSLVFAYNIGPVGTGATTLNGVTFSAFEFPPDGSQGSVAVGNLEIDEFPGYLYSASDFGNALPPFSELSPSYQSLLTTGGYTGGATGDFHNSMYVWLNSLTPNQEYMVEIWVSNASEKSDIVQTQVYDNDKQLTVTIDSTANSVGQFLTGTFTAQNSTEEFTLFAPLGQMTLLNAIQLRAIPEPSTWLMLGLGLVPVVSRLRKRS